MRDWNFVSGMNFHEYIKIPPDMEIRASIKTVKKKHSCLMFLKVLLWKHFPMSTASPAQKPSVCYAKCYAFPCLLEENRSNW